MKRIILFACLVVCLTIKATVTTSLKVEVLPAPCNKFCFHMLKIDQNFVFDKEDIKDTIKINIESNTHLSMYLGERNRYKNKQKMINRMLSQWADTKGDSLVISAIPPKVFVNGKQTEYYSPRRSSSPASIYIPTAKLEKTKINIHLQYVFCSLYKMFGIVDSKTKLCFDMFDSDGANYVCHFKTPNMRWQDVCFVNRNKDELLWINKHNTQRNDSIFIDGNSSPEDIEFFIINKKLNDNITYHTEQFSLNLFAPKHFDLEDKYKCTATSIHTDDRINKHFDETKNALTKVAKFFPEDTIHRNITVQYGGFDNGGAVYYNGYNKPTDFILIADTTKNFDRILFHEICHMFMPFDLSKMLALKKSDWDILVEGLNEYISRLVAYDTQEQVDSATTALFNKLSEREKNLKVLDSGYDTLKMPDRHRARYERIPYFLNLFVHEIGKDKFMTLFKKFCDFARKNDGVATLSDFERIAKSCGVNDEQWKNLINNL